MKALIRVQAASGAVFAFFLALHLTTSASASFGPATYDTVLATLRRVYAPHPAVEVVLLGIPAVVHLACAAISIWRRRGTRRLRPPLWLILHRGSGYVLVLFLAGHVFATRILPALSQAAAATGRADFSFLAFSLLNWPGFMWPYYVLLGTAGAVHLCLGLGLAARILLPRLVRTEGMRRVSNVAALIAAAVVAAGVVSMIANAATADRRRFGEFDALYRRYMPFMRTTVVGPEAPGAEARE